MMQSNVFSYQNKQYHVDKYLTVKCGNHTDIVSFDQFKPALIEKADLATNSEIWPNLHLIYSQLLQHLWGNKPVLDGR